MVMGCAYETSMQVHSRLIHWVGKSLMNKLQVEYFKLDSKKVNESSRSRLS